MTSSNLESSVVDDPREVATALVALLKRTQNRLILAESCTCGAAAAAIGSIPGASQVFCGSAVTYRETTKQAWLGITAADLKQHTAESQAITNAMATSVLERTPDATIAATITGHLGPDAPPAVDGILFIAVLQRGCELEAQRIVLRSSTRQSRQTEATANLLTAIQRYLSLPGHIPANE
ncbi:CinA family protein [Rhodopirellula halodulae]|uniref:CinA family protein n=1 Tax=Rhodopirellula halodulae TaxID=2894198 RepID=UPI001E600B51|nr:nicotinamide-nucleotide amidohydrolase family protein [Rhodopirellula sp. JC737]MCC9654466.1 nicotinamide-nucleotide amidohydrolase family protein [Rhodopirellula sp. JC737]